MQNKADDDDIEERAKEFMFTHRSSFEQQCTHENNCWKWKNMMWCSVKYSFIIIKNDFSSCFLPNPLLLDAHIVWSISDTTHAHSSNISNSRQCSALLILGGDDKTSVFVLVHSSPCLSTLHTLAAQQVEISHSGIFWSDADVCD